MPKLGSDLKCSRVKKTKRHAYCMQNLITIYFGTNQFIIKDFCSERAAPEGTVNNTVIAVLQ